MIQISIFKIKQIKFLITAIISFILLSSNPTIALDPQKKSEVKVGMLKFGTARWEMAVLKAKKFDKKNGIDLKLKEVAGKKASHTALMSGEADVVLSDFLWVAALRSKGEKFTIVPHSYAVGGLIVPSNGKIKKLTDLPGKTIGIAGGPLDKSWVVLQAYYKKLTGDDLADKVEARYGAPPMINASLDEGKIDAALNFWHWNARSKAKGFSELISVQDMMSNLNISPKPPLLGWVFRDDLSVDKKDAIKGFLNASFDTKEVLLSDDVVWDQLKGKMKANKDENLFLQLRNDYRKGIITNYDSSVVNAAADAFKVMAVVGGSKLVGNNKTMDPQTFWSDYSR